MTITRRVGSYGKMAALWGVIVVAVLCTALGALFLFAAALLVWLDHYVGPAAAAAIAGLVLLIEAIVIFICGGYILKRMRAKHTGSFGGDMLGLAALALRMTTLVIRRSPRKALITAAILGALADYFTSGRDSKN